ncbi:MAG: hypothetical protein GY782_11815, partial [Gammaproteobacteria bacterium]|nr:hypothetical protein [Gammaproteobacteria bacterium]
VGEIWEWVRFKLNQIDPALILIDDTDLLYLRFPRGLKEEDTLWMLGVYLAYVEDKIILRGMAASVNDFVGHARYMRSEANYSAMHSIGIIPGLNYLNTGKVQVDGGDNGDRGRVQVDPEGIDRIEHQVSASPDRGNLGLSRAYAES